jgi:hypothetical protein
VAGSVVSVPGSPSLWAKPQWAWAFDEAAAGSVGATVEPSASGEWVPAVDGWSVCAVRSTLVESVGSFWSVGLDVAIPSFDFDASDVGAASDVDPSGESEECTEGEGGVGIML